MWVHMIKIIRLLIVCFFLASISFNAIASDKGWLVGDWILTFDPDGDTKDRLTFKNGGQFISTEVSSGKQYKGLYSIKPKVIKVKLIHNGKTFLSLDLTYDEKKDKLYFKSNKTGTTSYYTKVR